MHVPDGLMDPLVAALGWLEFAVALSLALYLSKGKLKDRNLPRVAILSAGIFVAQMVNFPIGGGTTGHLIGAALFAIMVGPVLAIIGMTVVLLVQALAFGDGGLVAFGLNALNMAIVAPLVGWGVYELLKPVTERSGQAVNVAAVGLGAWASVFVAAGACAAELTVSYAVSGGTYGISPTISVPAMLGYHAVIAVGEALITAGLIAYLWSVSPEAFDRSAEEEEASGLTAWVRAPLAKATLAILFAFALVLPLYFVYASEGKDGLEQTMADADVEEEEPILASAFSYGEDYIGALLAGLLGFVAVALISVALMRVVGKGDR